MRGEQFLGNSHSSLEVQPSRRRLKRRRRFVDSSSVAKERRESGRYRCGSDSADSTLATVRPPSFFGQLLKRLDMMEQNLELLSKLLQRAEPGEQNAKRRRRTASRKYHCPVDDCEKSFIRGEHMRRHLREETDLDHVKFAFKLSPTVCIPCGKSFKRPEDFTRHEMSRHAKEFAKRRAWERSIFDEGYLQDSNIYTLDDECSTTAVESLSDQIEAAPIDGSHASTVDIPAQSSSQIIYDTRGKLRDDAQLDLWTHVYDPVTVWTPTYGPPEAIVTAYAYGQGGILDIPLQIRGDLQYTEDFLMAYSYENLPISDSASSASSGQPFCPPAEPQYSPRHGNQLSRDVQSQFAEPIAAQTLARSALGTSISGEALLAGCAASYDVCGVLSEMQGIIYPPQAA